MGPRNRHRFRNPFHLCLAILATVGWLPAFEPTGANAAAAPVLSPIADQVLSEDQPLLQVPFTVWDADTSPDLIRFTTYFYLVDGGGSTDVIVIGGAGSNRWFSIYPPADRFGTGEAAIFAWDDTGLRTTVRFQVQIIPVNDPPRILPIPPQVAIQGQNLLIVPFRVTDPDTTENRFKAWSSRQYVVKDSDLRILTASAAGDRNLSINLPPGGATGSTAITIQASDGHGSNTVSFVLNVQPPEFVASGDAVPGSGGTFQPFWGDFNGDGLLDLVRSPSEIYTNQGGGLFRFGIAIPAGLAASGGAADFDGDGNLDLLLYGQGTLQVLHNSGGLTPSFSEVPIRLDASDYAGPLFWADMDADGKPDIVGGQSFSIRWLRNEGGEFIQRDTGADRLSGVTLLAVEDYDGDGYPDVLANTGIATATPVLRLYRNDGTGRLVDSLMALPQQFIKAAGWADVDGDGLFDLWLVQSPAPVGATNSLVVLRQVDGQFQEIFRTGETWSPARPILPVWADFDGDGAVDFVGSQWSARSAVGPPTNFPARFHNDGTGRFTGSTVPVASRFGLLAAPPADIDDDGSPDLLFSVGSGFLPSRNQVRPFNPLPDPPSGLRAFVHDDFVALSWNDATVANHSVPLTYNVRVGTGPGKNDVLASMSTANGARLIPARGGAGYRTSFGLNLPLNRLSVETLYWTVQAVDNGFQGGPFAPEQTFLVNPPGNEPPVITGISDLILPEDGPGTLSIRVSDDRTPPDFLRVRATSANTNLFPQSNLKLAFFPVDDGALRATLTLIPLADRAGDAVITVTATDRAGLSVSRSFFVTVTPVNDPPVLKVAGTLLAFAGAPTPPLSVSASDKESPLEQLTLTAQSLTPQIVPDANLSVTPTNGGWQVVAAPSNAEPAQAVIQLTVRDPEGAEARQNVTIQFQPQLFIPFAAESAMGGWPNPLFWADLNGDRVPELLVGHGVDRGLTVHSVQPGSLPVMARLTPPLTEGRPVDLGDVDNDGDLDVLAVISPQSETSRLVVYRNLGNFAFEPLPGAVFDPGPAQFADFDQDGRLDVWVAASPINLVVYRNNGTGFDAARRVELTGPAPPELEAATRLEVIDLDGDGVPELVMGRSGYLSGKHRQTVYRRKADGFEAVTDVWTSYPVQSIVDLDGDQMPDLVLDYAGAGTVLFARNTGGLNFEWIGPTFARIGSALMLDFDGDGIMDLLGYSYNSGNRLYLGAGELVFQSFELPFQPASPPAFAPADFDGDGVMDLAVNIATGPAPFDGAPQVTVFRGQSLRANHPPSNPSGLESTASPGGSLRLTWNRAVDPEQSGGLTYNVRVGTAPGLGDVLSPMSLADGYRLLPRRGNAGWNTNLFLTGLQPGHTYFWSVQAVDNSFAGGTFATEASFTVPDVLLSLSRTGQNGFEFELQAAPSGSWQVETSIDLNTWQPYSTSGVTLQGDTNGVTRLDLGVTSEQQFFRARRRAQ